MTIDQTLDQMKRLRCPHEVDVVERVMAEVARIEAAKAAPRRVRPLWSPYVMRRAGAVAASLVLLVVAVSVLSITTRRYDEEGMGRTLAQVNDYSSWHTIEEPALNPIAYLYE